MQRVLICTLVLGATAAAADLPLFFEPNQGQSQPGVEFLSRGNGVSSNLNATAAEFPIGKSTVRMQLAGAAAANGEGLDRLPGKSSYFNGADSSRWHTGIPQFGRVRYRNVYPGVDVTYYGNQGKLEYDFNIAPGARPSDIHVVYSGIEKLSVGRDGSLLLKTASGEIRQRKPVVYQEANGKRTRIAASYRLGRDGQVGFELGRYDSHLPLVVDPVLEYATFLGGTFTQGSFKESVRVDAAGNVYLAGIVNPADSTPSGTANLVKFSPAQNRILYWVTYGSGTGAQTLTPSSLAIDSQGSAYICGVTSQTNMPTVNAYQSRNNSSYGNGFVAKFAPDGQSLVYSTYLGGSMQAWLYGIAVDSSGNAFVTGETTANDYPVLNAVQSTNKTVSNPAANGAQAVMAGFSPTGSLLFSTYFGGAGGAAASGVAVGSDGSPVFVGTAEASGGYVDFPATANAIQSVVPPTESAFAAKFTPTGQLVFATLFGGDYSIGYAVAVDSQNNIYAGGEAQEGKLTVVNGLISQPPGIHNAFVAKLSPDGSRLLYSTYLGGYGIDDLYSVGLDSTGNIYAAGVTSSPNFPVKNSLVQFQNQTQNGRYPQYGFLTKISPDGQSLIYSTLIGGNASSTEVLGMAVTPSGSAYLTGTSSATNLPTPNAFQSTLPGVDPSNPSGAFTVFLAKLDDASGDTPTPYTPPAAGASIYASPNTASFNLAQNGSAGTATFTVTSSPAGTSFTATTGVTPTWVNGSINTTNWLSVSPASGTAPTLLTVTADPAGLPAGNYNGTVTLTPTNGQPSGVSVIMTVSPGIATTATLAAAPSSLSFTVAQGGTTLAQTVALSGTPSTVPVTLVPSTTAGGNWLSVNPSSSTTPFQALVTVNAQGLAAGTYTGAIQVTPTVPGSGTNVLVTMTVTGSSQVAPSGAAPAIASVSPASLTSNQQNQVVTVKGSGFTSQTAASMVLANYEFPASLTPVTLVDANTLTITVRGVFLFQPGSLGLRLTNPGAAGSAGFALAVQ